MFAAKKWPLKILERNLFYCFDISKECDDYFCDKQSFVMITNKK